MDKLKLGFDDNLGLPSDFAAKVNCKTVSYHDLGLLLNAFESNELDAVFIPVGTLPYIQEYEIAAQSLFTSAKKTVLQSNFISTQNISIREIPKLTLGCVNKYCTTSFWAPMVYLLDYLPGGTTLNFKDTNGFADLLHKAALDQVDCAMEWDIFLKNNPQDASKVKEYFFLSNLPTPVIVAKPGVSLPSDMINFASQDDKAFFTGFKAPEMNSINAYLDKIAQAREHFKIVTDASLES